MVRLSTPVASSFVCHHMAHLWLKQIILTYTKAQNHLSCVVVTLYQHRLMKLSVTMTRSFYASALTKLLTIFNQPSDVARWSMVIFSEI